MIRLFSITALAVTLIGLDDATIMKSNPVYSRLDQTTHLPSLSLRVQHLFMTLTMCFRASPGNSGLPDVNNGAETQTM